MPSDARRRVEIVRMSDKSFYSEAKKVMAVDFFPTSNKVGGYTSLNPFKHFLKKQELFTPAETAEMLSAQNRTRSHSRISLKITKTGGIGANTAMDAAPVIGDAAAELPPADGVDSATHYPNETIDVSDVDVTAAARAEETTRDDASADKTKDKGDGKSDSQ